MITKKYYKLVKVSYEDEGQFYVKNVDNTTGTLTINAGNNLDANIEYSTDGVNWTTADSNAPFSLTVPAGGNVYMRGTNSSLNDKTINMDANHTVGGNVMTLLDKTNSITSVGQHGFRRMFYNNTHLISAEYLSFGNLTSVGYGGMAGMFRGCSSLVNAPETLPALTIDSGAYAMMFDGCSLLENAPKILATIASGAYGLQEMFLNCSSLNTVTCLIESASSGSFDSWLNGVSSTGTFYKSSNSTLFAAGQNGVPSTWTVTDYQL